MIDQVPKLQKMTKHVGDNSRTYRSNHESVSYAMIVLKKFLYSVLDIFSLWNGYTHCLFITFRDMNVVAKWCEGANIIN